MQVSNIMTRRVISVVPDDAIDTAIELMLKHHISGLPVIDDKGELVGIVTEGDFLRRPETSTEHRTGSRWRDAFFSSSKVTENYVHTHGMKVKDVMTPNPLTVAEDTPLDEVVGLMQTRNVKRLPVVRSGKVIEIISRANLMRALVSIHREAHEAAEDDARIRERILDDIAGQIWAEVCVDAVEYRRSFTRRRQGHRFALREQAGFDRPNMLWELAAERSRFETACEREEFPLMAYRVVRGGSPDNVVGAISLAIRTITIIVAIKYALLVLSAENDGEGGVFALYGLLHRFKSEGGRVLLWSLMLGAGLLFGDGMITPAISVLSAVEELEVATPAFAPYVLPITVALLTGLFAIQFKGTSGIGVVFGPLLIVWFVAIAALGGAEIAREPAILAAFNPAHGATFLARAGLREVLLILGAM